MESVLYPSKHEKPSKHILGRTIPNSRVPSGISGTEPEPLQNASVAWYMQVDCFVGIAATRTWPYLVSTLVLILHLACKSHGIIFRITSSDHTACNSPFPFYAICSNVAEVFACPSMSTNHRLHSKPTPMLCMPSVLCAMFVITLILPNLCFTRKTRPFLSPHISCFTFFA